MSNRVSSTAKETMMSITLTILAMLGCSNKSNDSSPPEVETQFIERNDNLFPPLTSQCETDLPPVLMAHGFLAAGDTYDEFALRLVANGHCPDLIFTYDWNTFSQGDSLSDLESAIDTILEQSGATQVDLMGHSAGGGLGFSAITSRTNQDQTVCPHRFRSERLRTPVPTLNLYSLGDTVVQGADMANATNVVLSDADHFEVATRVDAFENIYNFLYVSSATTTAIQTEDELEIWGKALGFGENNPMSDVEMSWYRIEPDTGERFSETPDFVQIIGDNGLFGPIPAISGERYEILLDADIPVRHYYLPFTASHRHLRLRAVPESGLAATLLSSVPSMTTSQGSSELLKAASHDFWTKPLTFNGSDAHWAAAPSIDCPFILTMVLTVKKETIRLSLILSHLFEPWIRCLNQTTAITLIFNLTVAACPSPTGVMAQSSDFYNVIDVSHCAEPRWRSGFNRHTLVQEPSHCLLAQALWLNILP